MRPDQIARLHELSEKLADSFIAEADPADWPGSGRSTANLTQQERGDAYWCKRNAMATGGVLRYTLDLIEHHATPMSDQAEDHEADMDRNIRDAERRAAAAMQRVVGKAKQSLDDGRVYGKDKG